MTKTATKTAEAATDASSDVVLFGLDESGKPVAARFGSEQIELAAKAAGLMGLTIYHVNSPAMAQVARKLPAGRIYASGRGFVPNVRRDLYAKLLELTATNNGGNGPTKEESADAGSNADQSTRTEAEPPQAAAAHPYPRDWDDISIGHLVIANERAGEGWWEAIVIAREGDMLTMRWRDYPKQPKFTQHRSVVALLSPGTS